MRFARLRLALALVYTAALWTPAAHDHFFAEEPCGDCDEVLAAGPRWAADCNRSGPCSDRSHHHHHRGHVHDECLSCHAAPAVGLPVTPALAVQVPRASGPQPAARGPAPRRLLPPGLYPARAPPACS